MCSFSSLSNSSPADAFSEGCLIRTVSVASCVFATIRKSTSSSDNQPHEYIETFTSTLSSGLNNFEHKRNTSNATLISEQSGHQNSACGSDAFQSHGFDLGTHATANFNDNIHNLGTLSSAFDLSHGSGNTSTVTDRCPFSYYHECFYDQDVNMQITNANVSLPSVHREKIPAKCKSSLPFVADSTSVNAATHFALVHLQLSPAEWRSIPAAKASVQKEEHHNK